VGLLFTVWAFVAMGPAPEAEYALVSGAGVEVARTERGIEFAPSDGAPEYGIVFYPGGKVDPVSYATLARDYVEEHDALVVVTPVLFNLAILSTDEAASVIEAYPDIEDWAVAGHSLGGVAACAFAAERPDAVDAVILLAAYPAESTDLSEAGIPVLSVWASEDSVMDRDAFEAAKSRLPDDARYVEIEGGNHAQFGSYGEQNGDSPASIPAERQRAETIEAMSGFLEEALE
jgi:dienelactone hydrolase